MDGWMSYYVHGYSGIICAAVPYIKFPLFTTAASGTSITSKTSKDMILFIHTTTTATTTDYATGILYIQFLYCYY